MSELKKLGNRKTVLMKLQKYPLEEECEGSVEKRKKERKNAVHLSKNDGRVKLFMGHIMR